jgi:hypothetical protein
MGLTICFLSEWPSLGHSKEECNIDYILMDEKYAMRNSRVKGVKNDEISQ